MTNEMVWQQQEDFSWKCDVSNDLVYKIDKGKDEDGFLAFAGYRSYYKGGGINISWRRINFPTDTTDKMHAALKACAAHFAECSTKHVVKSITEVDAFGNSKYLVSEYLVG